MMLRPHSALPFQLARPLAYVSTAILAPSLITIAGLSLAAASEAIATPQPKADHGAQVIDQPQAVVSVSPSSLSPSDAGAVTVPEADVEIPPPVGLLAVVCGAAFCLVASIGFWGNQSDEFLIEQDLADHEAALAEGEFLLQE